MWHRVCAVVAVATCLGLSVACPAPVEGGGEGDAGEGEGEGEGEEETAACPASQVLCGERCVDPLTDNAHCGAADGCTGDDAGVACADGFVCDGTGVCAPTCAAPHTACDDRCADLDDDEDHCGGCGIACGDGETCTDGTCCRTGLLGCDGRCVNAVTDTANCGGCGVVCAEGAGCKDAACVCPGNAPDICDDACVDLRSDVEHCGRCGNVCDDGTICSDGACVDLGAIDAWSIATIDLGSCVLAEHGGITGDDRGGLATTRDAVLYTGDSSTGRFDLLNPGDGRALGVLVDGLFSDLATGQLYSFGRAGRPFVNDGRDGEPSFTELLRLDDNGVVVGEPIALSTPLTDVLPRGQAGVFVGLGRIVLVVGIFEPEPVAHFISLRSGLVTSTPIAPMNDVQGCENWALWGLLETIGGDDWLTTVRAGDLVRTRIPDGRTELVQRFDGRASDLCALSVSLFRDRFAFHYEGQGFAGGNDESVGSCAVSFCFDGSCACPERAPTHCGGACADTRGDVNHCGGCGIRCGAGEACVDGRCGCPPEAPVGCSDAAGNLVCTNLDVDVANCGACGTVCADGSQCVPGAGCACFDTGATICPSPFNEAGVCANLDTDPQHCGGCDVVCDRNVPCVAGQCQPFAFTCGNGQLEPGEDCDDGNDVDDLDCPAGCVFPACGPRQGSCFDFNPCTVDACVDDVVGVCDNAPAPDGTPCEADGDPATADRCQRGFCAVAPPPPPDPALLVLDPVVLEQPAFSFAAMHERLSVDGDGSALFASWADTLARPHTKNGVTAAPRPAFVDFVTGLPRDVDGRIDLDAADFRAAAMVNRVDLFGFGGCGEFRVVYTKDTGLTDRNNRMTVIFEFDVPDDGAGCRDVVGRWTALRGLAGQALADAALALLEDFALPGRLAQLRTNEFIFNPTWELRQFHLEGGAFVPVGVSDSPPFALAGDRDFRDFVVDNAGRFNAGAREQDLIPDRFLGPSSLASGERLFIGPLVPSLPGLEANLNIMTCAGCHLTETGTGFVHIGERDVDRPADLSPFMRSELVFRALLLEDLGGR